MKTTLYGTDGKKVSEITLPSQFSEAYHPDLIKRAVEVILSNKRQQYGASPLAGKRSSARISKRRRDYRGSYGHGISRVPRKVMWRRGTQFGWEGAFAPGTKGGRKAHPPKSEKIFKAKINLNEKRKAIRSAISATLNKELVEKRGHLLGKEFPLFIDSKAESINKTKDVKKMLLALGLQEEIKRISKKKIRAGKGKARGRKYTKPRGILIVTSSRNDLMNSSSNLPGVETIEVKNLNTEILAPGANPGRLTIFTEKAVKEIESKNMFRRKVGR